MNGDPATRRAVLGGLAVAPVAGLPFLAPALGRMTRGRNDDMLMERIETPAIEIWAANKRAEANARFWQLHADWKTMLAEWEADPDDSDENWNRWGARVAEVETAMYLAPVFSAAAVYAKLEANDDPDGYELPYPANNVRGMILFDLKRLAKQELLQPVAA